MSQSRALITGIGGQDGSYLADLLLSKGYEVHGIDRHAGWVEGKSVVMHDADMANSEAIRRVIAAVQPNEVYNFAAQSHVGESFVSPLQTADVTGVGVLRILEAIRALSQPVRFCQASSSEIFGNSRTIDCNEETSLAPTSPYACAKAFGHFLTGTYRQAYGMHASCAILFNHESPRRGEDFVTRKITRGLARVKLGLQESLTLGNIESQRDWGFAGDYVFGMWSMLQQPMADDYVLATGETHSVREFLDAVGSYLDLDWHGVVQTDPGLARPSDTRVSRGDSSKAFQKLGWKCQTSFLELAESMAAADLARARGDRPA